MDNHSRKKDSTSLVRIFQTARLDEWIGDLQKANERYEELKEEAEKEERTTKGLAYIMEPVVRERKKKVEDDIDRYNLAYADRTAEVVSSLIELYDEDRLVRLFNTEQLKPKSDFKNLIDPIEVNWKYSVLIASKSGSELRLEVRGYNPTDNTPKLNLNTQKLKGLALLSIEIEPDQYDIDLLNISGRMNFLNTPIQFSIDRWGLLSGTSIIEEEHLGDLLIHLHYLIHEIDKQIWVN